MTSAPPTPVIEEAVVTPIPDSSSSRQGRVRLEFLDGLRGLAAFYVLLFHARYAVAGNLDDAHLPSWFYWTSAWMQPGYYAVGVFILLSGYCLMLPVVRSADGKLRGGVGSYLKRRARRILPPYYATLAISLLIILLIPGMSTPAGVWWDQSLPAFGSDVIWSHLLLVHNFSEAWQGKINGVLWSIAAEWQIYFLFPLFLLPLWRKFGVKTLVLVSFLIPFLPFLAIGGLGHRLRPWYISLFALGMAGAAIGFSQIPKDISLRDKGRWGTVAAVFFGLFGLLWGAGLVLHNPRLWLQMRAIEIILGFATVATIILCARSLSSDSDAPLPAVLRLLDHRWVVWLGTFSYSLYLTHAPVLALLHLAARTAHFSMPAIFVLMLGAGVPLSVAVAYGFHVVFERRFMPGHLAAVAANKAGQ
jgi:peptidoglycan/LPS O-acetylase OafA/YrhL